MYTWRLPGKSRINDLRTNSHSQIDLILTTRRWVRGFKDAEADPNANINTDHNPVFPKTDMRLRDRRTVEIRETTRYQKCTPEQKKQINEEMIQQTQKALEDHTPETRINTMDIIQRKMRTVIKSNMKKKENNNKKKETMSEKNKTILELRSKFLNNPVKFNSLTKMARSQQNKGQQT